jgi:hypothetical protein
MQLFRCKGILPSFSLELNAEETRNRQHKPYSFNSLLDNLLVAQTFHRIKLSGPGRRDGAENYSNYRGNNDGDDGR